LIIHLDGTPSDPAGFDGIDATLSSPATAPEPATWVLLFGGLIAVGAYKRAAYKRSSLQ
jgi:hypothetical protein